MDWIIYSIGDSAFLAGILNAVAMMAGSGDYISAAKIGFGIGILMICWQAIIKGGNIQWQTIVASLVIYSMFFATPSRVVIEDVYNDQVRVVDNVPIGVAAAGSIVSRLGFSLTQMFEQAFSTPAMTEQGFAYSVNTMRITRNITQGLLTNSAFDRSWTNYLASCTLVGRDLGVITDEDIANKPLPQAWKFDGGEWYYTEIYVPNGEAQTMTCGQAYDVLAAYLEGVHIPTHVMPALAKIMTGNSANTSVVELMMRDALDGVQKEVVDVSDYTKALVLTPIYNKGILSKCTQENNPLCVAAVNRSIIERQLQAEAGRAQWINYVIPVMTFFEGLVYALTPIMVFASALGPIGLGVLAKYLMFTLWIQLWMPAMAIVNFYIHMATSGTLARLQEVAPDLSMRSIELWETAASDFLVIGNSMAAMIPMITLFLVSGSYYVMAKVADMEGKGIAGGASPADTGAIAPAFMQRTPIMSGDSIAGARTSGIDSMVGSYNFQEARGQMIQSASARAAQAQQAWQQSLQRTYGQQWNEAVSSNTTDQFMERLQASGGETWAHINKLGADIESSTGIDRTVANKLAANASFGGNVSASLDGGLLGKGVKAITGAGMGVKATVGSHVSNEHETGETEKFSEASKLAMGYANTAENRAGLARALETDSSRGITTSAGFASSQSDAESLSKTSSEMVSASESYSKVASESQNWGLSGSISNLAIASHHGYDRMMGTARSLGITENAVGQNAERWMRAGMPYSQAMGISALDLMQRSGVDGKLAADRLAAEAGLASPFASISGADRNANLATPEGGTRGIVDGANLNVDPSVAGVGSRVDDRIADTQAAAGDWGGQVHAGAAQLRADADSAGAAQYASQADRMIADAEAKLAHDLGVEPDPHGLNRSSPAEAIHKRASEIGTTLVDMLDKNTGHWMKDLAGFSLLRDNQDASAIYKSGYNNTHLLADAATARGLEMGLTEDQARYFGALVSHPGARLGEAWAERPMGRETDGSNYSLPSEYAESIQRLTPLEMRAVEAGIMQNDGAALGRLKHINELKANR